MDAVPLRSSPNLARDDTRKLILDLCEQVHALERRVAALEQHTASVTAHPAPETLPVPELAVSADTVPALGRALLGFAGAYLLRALTEMGVWPRAMGVSAGVAYAGLWLWLAARSSRKFTAALNAFTAILILGPLLWEAVVRLHAVPSWAAAATLVVFSITAQVFDRVALTPVLSSIAAPACAWIAIVLLFGTEDLVPFTAALLAMGAAAELAQIRSRSMVAVAADCAVLLMAGLTGRSAGLPESYAPVSMRASASLAILLAAIYLTAALRRTLLERQPFSIFCIAQTAFAFVAGVGGAWFVTRAHVAYATPALAWITLAAGVSCYAILPRAGHRRNLYTYAAFAAALTAAALWMIAPGASLNAAAAALAIALFFLNPGKLGNWNASVFIWLAAVVSPHPAVIVFPAALILYAILIRRRDEFWPALLVAGGMLTSLMEAVIAHERWPAAAILALCSLALAAAGTRLGRRELVWLMYATMATAGWLLVAREFQSSATMMLVVSLLLFGATLILLPRILRQNR